jgi:hypothetical protein
MYVFDFDGDGDSDVVGSSAHRRGIWWYEHDGDKWTTHKIDDSIAQTHALVLADMNGDGLPDLVTGKRFYAHNGRDPGEDEPPTIAWYELSREGDTNIAATSGRAENIAATSGRAENTAATSGRAENIAATSGRAENTAATSGRAVPKWTKHEFDADSGVGTQFEVHDMNADGLLDVIVANKRGVFYFEQVRE